MKKNLYPLLIFHFTFFIFTGCSVEKQISRSATRLVLKDSSLTTAHVGISIYEPAANKFWFNYQSDHYFVPASNTKIPTCYAAMKYLGDSLSGIVKVENDTAIFFFPTGDPTLLHPDFKQQPVITFFQSTNKNIYTSDTKWKERALGSGWSWNDYNENYMAERSPMPVYGNLVKWVQDNSGSTVSVYTVPEVNWKVDFNPRTANSFSVRRDLSQNSYAISTGKEKYKEQSVPFVTDGIQSTLELLVDTVHKSIGVIAERSFQNILPSRVTEFVKIKTQPTDSVLKPMMHRSDNFFAEQSLLMVSNELLGVMSDERIIDTLLKTDFKDLPQKPRWVDGSGLSRYNLFTPQDFVSILNKMKNEFGMERIKLILPTGNEGTLSNYYKAENGYLFGKTGSLSGVVALSGFLYTKKNKLVIFSVLVNNHNVSASAVRRAVEKFIEGIREDY
jgi:serine-type D-Ala-D-Ala carboxypeptidase/endopeptidase (penicillin-binding protein 4)